jgi:outer membrane lipoprotein-sorting protein
MRTLILTIIALLLVPLLLSACASKGTASDAVENYLKAKIASDDNKLVSLSCKDWEAQALLEAKSFESVTAEFKDMSCKEAGKADNYTLVTCDGTLIIQYRGEDPRQQSLGGTTYRAIKEDGKWKMCGVQQ